jgi:hypothetical protein
MKKPTQQSEVGLDAVVMAGLSYQEAINTLFGNDIMSNSATKANIIVGHELWKLTWKKTSNGFDEIVKREHIANYASESFAYNREWEYRKDRNTDSVKVGETYTSLDVRPLWVKTDGLSERP